MSSSTAIPTASSAAPTTAVATSPPAAPATAATSKSQQPETPPDTTEAQNPLTKEFTAADWSAIKALRQRLPEIFSKAYDENPDAKTTPITLWGVKIDPAAPEKDARVSVVLIKFLRASNMNINHAADKLVSTLRWRDEFDVEAACKEVFPKDIFEHVGRVYGKDKAGRPVVYNSYGKAGDVFEDVSRFLRWRIALMETSISLLDFESVDQTIQVHDYEGISIGFRDTNSKNAANEATSIFQSYYPELLYRKFFVNIPLLLTWIFELFKPLISANTLAKMTVVGSGPAVIGKALLQFIDEAELPKKYGGSAPDF